MSASEFDVVFILQKTKISTGQICHMTLYADETLLNPLPKTYSKATCQTSIKESHVIMTWQCQMHNYD